MKSNTAAFSLFFVAQLFYANLFAATTNEIQQYGITWTFSTQIEFGQFVNGDYWVVDPGEGISIVGITPGHTLHPTTGRHMHGSMINPSDLYQGFDQNQFFYEASLNVGIGVSPETPLTLTSNNSLVTAISTVDRIGTESYLKTAAILTCLPSAPANGSFRPGYSDPQKTIYGKVSDLDYSKLGTLTPVASTPSLSTYAGYFQKTWLMHSPDFTSRFMHPTENIPDNYYYTRYASTAALLLNLDFTNEEKSSLLINFIQHGIDLYGAIKARNAGWWSSAGVGYSRKWPILFAGIMLNAADMQNIGSKSGDYLYQIEGYGPGNPPVGYVNFAEDALTFYVTQSMINSTSGTMWVRDFDDGALWHSFDVDSNTFTLAIPPQGATLGPWRPDTRNKDAQGKILCRPFYQSHLRMPEWGNDHAQDINKTDANWLQLYRSIGSGISAASGSALAAYIMNAKTMWNHNAFFDYTDRYMAISKGDRDPFGYTVADESAGGRPSGFLSDMWDTYRRNYPYPPYARRTFRNVRLHTEE